MRLRVRAPGSCGELLQGCLDGRPFLVTCPVDLYAEAAVSDGWPPDLRRGLGPKAALALEKTLAHLGAPPFPFGVSLQSALPRGKGMASSSADIAAVACAAAAALGKALAPDELARVAAAIEPTDGIFYEGVVAFRHRDGVCLEPLGVAPPMRIAIFDTGGEVDTLRFNRRGDLTALQRESEPEIAAALSLLRRGIAGGDPALIGAAATASARLNQRILYKSALERLIALGEACGAVGVNAAHSGTVLGLLFDERGAGLEEAVRLARRRCPDLAYLGDVRLISGGCEISEEETNGTI